VPQAKFIKLFA